MLRRALLLAPMLLLLWMGAASAQVTPIPDYPPPTPPTVGPGTFPPTFPPVSVATTLPGEREGEVVIQGQGQGGPLARTGSNNIVPLVQAAIVLLGAGTLLVLVARRRRTVRRAAGATAA